MKRILLALAILAACVTVTVSQSTTYYVSPFGDPDLPGGAEWWPHTAAIWLAGCTETVMQFNEVYNTGRQPGNGDGFAYDFDFNCRNCILQYNYSSNGHGLLLILNRAYNNIARYNISHNDQTHLIQIHGYTEDGNIIHNNLFYVDHSTVFLINCCFGPWLKGLPEDPKKLIADPLFVAPGTTGAGFSSLKGYKLQPGSPCIDAGEPVEINYRRDFFGNHLLDDSIDVGIFEYGGPES